MIRCPFCKNDPFHYVHNGLGMEAVAVDCCDLGVTLYSRDPHNEADRRSLYRVLRLRRSHSPRRKARAARILEALYAKWEQ